MRRMNNMFGDIPEPEDPPDDEDEEEYDVPHPSTIPDTFPEEWTGDNAQPA